MNRGACDITAEIIAQLMWGPKTIGQIIEAVGIKPNHSTWSRHYKALKASGLVRVHSWVNARQAVLAIQPHPFALPDADKPKPKTRRNPLRQPPHYRTLGTHEHSSMGR